MQAPKKPWGRAMHIYDHPLKQGDIKTISEDSEKLTRIQNCQFLIQDVVREKVRMHGLEGKSLLDIDPGYRQNILGGDIRLDPSWRRHSELLVSLIAPDLPFDEKIINAITRPDFNTAQLDFKLAKYDDGKLAFEVGYSHSYGDLISAIRDDSGKLAFPQLKIYQVSVVGVILTEDGYLVPANRGGSNFRLTTMCTPAGTAEPHTGKNPLFESFDKEGKEELGLNPPELYGSPESGLVAITMDYALGPRLYAVFKSRVPLKFSELEQRWKDKARDRYEHNNLVNLPDDGDEFIYLLNRRVFDFECIDPKKVSVTHHRNFDAYLPQMNISTLASYAQSNGVEWARNAEEKTQGYYSLVPGFSCEPFSH